MTACASKKESQKNVHLVSTTETEASTKTTQSSEKPKATYANRTVTAEEGILKITGTEKATTTNGTPIFFITFDLTNKTQNTQMLLLGFLGAGQKIENKLKDLPFVITINSPYQEKLDLLNEDIKPGKTVHSAYVYQFADETKPVILLFRDRMFSYGKPFATEEIIVK